MCLNEWDLRERELRVLEARRMHEVMEHHRLEVLDRQAREHLHDEHLLARRRLLQRAQHLTRLMRQTFGDLFGLETRAGQLAPPAVNPMAEDHPQTGQAPPAPSGSSP